MHGKVILTAHSKFDQKMNSYLTHGECKCVELMSESVKWVRFPRTAWKFDTNEHL